MTQRREQPPAEVGEGYPEDAEPGTGIDPHEHAENEVPEPDAPSTSAPQDGDPGQATGNPHAAGSDDD